eukprot:Skav231700  [mRNA]  locus=scaffold1306:21039:37468:- [translate_table: standard]
MEFNEHFPLHQQPLLAEEELMETMADRALRMLRAGITTARDLGGRNFAALSLREKIRQKRVPGPRLLCAGQPLTAPKGHCHQWGGEARDIQGHSGRSRRSRDIQAPGIGHEQVFLSFCEAGSVEEALKVVERQAGHRYGTHIEGSIALETLKGRAQVQNGADWIKVVEKAAEHSRPVAAHAHGAKGVIAAVEAGCRTVEHCTWIAKAGDWGCVNQKTVEERLLLQDGDVGKKISRLLLLSYVSSAQVMRREVNLGIDFVGQGWATGSLGTNKAKNCWASWQREKMCIMSS